ncbi:MAG: LpqB family beta-propeller domain-containing protein [Nocardioides sp.]
MSGSACRLRPAALLAAMLAIAGAVSGCLRMPEAGPLVTADGPVAEEVAPYFDPAEPRSGESPTEIAEHFLDAMTATSLRTNVARKFLSREAQSRWNPDSAIITYAEAGAAQGSRTVNVALTRVNRLDSSGAWLGASALTSLSFPMVLEDGEYRIDETPDALIVPQQWFEQRFTRVTLYYFDPTGTILVPEPAYVPRGPQLATSLVQSLLDGPRSRNADVAQSFTPSGARVELSVTVEQGVATIALKGPPNVPPEVVPEMLAQFAWTLRQAPGVRDFRVTVGDKTMTLGGNEQHSVDYGTQFDPAVAGADTRLFGLDDDGLVVVNETATPQDGAFDGGRNVDSGISEVAVDLAGTRVAVVDRDGRRMLVGGLAPGDEAVQVLSQAEDLTKPVWDFDGRLWAVDRRRRGAVISVVTGTTAAPLRIPAVTGERVRGFTVSRDSSRFVAVVRRADSDAVVVGRIEHDAQGRPVRVGKPTTIAVGTADNPLVVTGLGWRTPTVLALVVNLSGDRDEIRLLSVDGSPHLGAGLDYSRRLPARVTRLAVAPVGELPMLASTRLGVVDPFGDVPVTVDPSIDMLTYPG